MIIITIKETLGSLDEENSPPGTIKKKPLKSNFFFIVNEIVLLENMAEV